MLFTCISVDHLAFFIAKCEAKSKQKMHLSLIISDS
jgi:hypothetical protein